MSAAPTLAHSTLGRVSHVWQGLTARVSLVQHGGPTVLPAHDHAHATVTISLGGTYAETVGGREHRLTPMTALLKPAGAAHANRIGAGGARSLLLELDQDGLERLGRAGRLLHAPRLLALGPTAALAIAIGINLRRVEDAVAPLALDSLVFEWFDMASGDSPSTGDRAPKWLARVRDHLHAVNASEIRLAELARDVGHHPSYVARTFRRHYGISIGTYARRLRLARAAQALVLRPMATIGRVAVDTGYCDHSHLTHDFHARAKASPAEWRRLATGQA